MADRYWVGGTAIWDGTAGTKWAATSGGAGGQSVPTSADNVFFDANSGVNTVTVSGTRDCANLTCTGFTGTLTGTSTPNLQIYGNMTLVAGMTFNTALATITFKSTTTGKTITSAGKTLSAVIFDGVGGEWTLSDALTLNNNITITNGTFKTGNFNLTATGLISNNSNTRTITLGSSTVTLSNDLNIQTLTGLTFNSNTSTINITNANLFSAGLTFYNVSITNTSNTNSITVSGVNTYNDLTFSTAASGNGVIHFQLNANQIINGALNLSSNSTTNRRPKFFSNTRGTQRTFKIATLASVTNADFRDIGVDQTGTVKTISGTSIGNCGGNSNITFTAAKTVYWNLSGTQDWNANGWAATSGGSPNISNYPLPQDTAIFDNSGAAGTVRPGISNVSMPNIDMSARTSAMTVQPSNSGQTLIYGDIKLGTGVTSPSVNVAFNFSNSGTTQTITSNGVTIGFAIVVNNVGGTVQIADALNISSSGGGIFLSNGTFNAANYNVTVPNTQLSAGTKTLTMGSGTWTLSSTGTVWNMSSNSSGLTFNKDTANIVLSDTSSTARTFAGNGLTYNDLTIGGATGTSTLTITGANTFSTLASTKTVAHTISFSANQTIGTWSVTGTSGNVVTVNSTVAGTRRDFTLTNVTSGIDYLSVKDIGVTDPNRFYVGANSTDGGNNSNVYFTAAPTVSSSSNFLLMF